MALPPAWTPPQGFGLPARCAPLPRAQRPIGCGGEGKREPTETNPEQLDHAEPEQEQPAMSMDPEIEQLKAGVNCATVLERMGGGYALDQKESSRIAPEIPARCGRDHHH